MTNDTLPDYDSFRTGLTFKEVRRMLWSNSDDPTDWPHVTRHTVLGKWRQIKKEMYHEACGYYSYITENTPF